MWNKTTQEASEEIPAHFVFRQDEDTKSALLLRTGDSVLTETGTGVPLSTAGHHSPLQQIFKHYSIL